MNVAQIYRQAAEDLQLNGWIRGDWSNSNGKCLVQALMDAAGIKMRVLPLRVTRPLDEVLVAQPAYMALCQQEQYQGKEGRTNRLVRWNDMEGRTPREVITLLEMAAIQLDADEIRRLNEENQRLNEENARLKQRVFLLEMAVLHFVFANARLRKLVSSLAGRVQPVHPELVGLDDLLNNGGEGFDVSIKPESGFDVGTLDESLAGTEEVMLDKEPAPVG